MMYKSHALLGLSAGLSTSIYFEAGATNMILSVVAGYVGSLVPDIDHTKSFISKRLPVIPTIVSFVFSHRGFTHSLLFLSLMFFAFQIYSIGNMSYIVEYSFLAGFVSHVLADMCTVGGVRVFWPLPLKIGFYLIKTGSKHEFKIAIALSVIFILFPFKEVLIQFVSGYINV